MVRNCFLIGRGKITWYTDIEVCNLLQLKIRLSAQFSDFAAYDKGRQLLSPDSEAIIMWTVSNNLNHGQWQKLFTKLMNKSEEIIPPQEIKGNTTF